MIKAGDTISAVPLNTGVNGNRVTGIVLSLNGDTGKMAYIDDAKNTVIDYFYVYEAENKNPPAIGAKVEQEQPKAAQGKK